MKCFTVSDKAVSKGIEIVKEPFAHLIPRGGGRKGLQSVFRLRTPDYDVVPRRVLATSLMQSLKSGQVYLVSPRKNDKACALVHLKLSSCFRASWAWLPLNEEQMPCFLGGQQMSAPSCSECRERAEERTDEQSEAPYIHPAAGEITSCRPFQIDPNIYIVEHRYRRPTQLRQEMGPCSLLLVLEPGAVLCIEQLFRKVGRPMKTRYFKWGGKSLRSIPERSLPRLDSAPDMFL